MDYSKFAQVANQLLSKFGGSATLTHKVGGTYNPATSIAPVTTVVDNVKVAMFPYSSIGRPGDQMIDGSMIHAGDLQVFMSPTGVTADPQAADQLTVGGVTYTVVAAKNYKPAEVAVLYELQVRK